MRPLLCSSPERGLPDSREEGSLLPPGAPAGKMNKTAKRHQAAEDWVVFSWLLLGLQTCLRVSQCSGRLPTAHVQVGQEAGCEEGWQACE